MKYIRQMVTLRVTIKFSLGIINKLSAHNFHWRQLYFQLTSARTTAYAKFEQKISGVC